MNTKTAVHANPCSENAANVFLQVRRYLLNNLLFAYWKGLHKPRRRFYTSIIKFLIDSYSNPSFPLSRSLCLLALLYYHPKKIMTNLPLLLKPDSSQSVFSYLSETSGFSFSSTLFSILFLPGTTQPHQPLYSRLPRKTISLYLFHCSISVFLPFCNPI